MPAALLALLAASAALLSYRYIETWTSKSWLPAGCRAAGWAALALLLFNASCPAPRRTDRPLVLLDASLSMQAAGGKWTEAVALARGAGEVRMVGIPAGDTTPTAGRSRLASAILAARSGLRPVLVVTDGEIEDADALTPEQLTTVGVRVLERATLADVALVRVQGSTRLTPTDSLRIEVETESTGGAKNSPLRIEVREGDRVWLQGTLPVDSGGRGRLLLRGPLPKVAPGAHVLQVAIVGADDGEPRTDTRLHLVTIVPTPGIVLLASPPTWESRFLLQALTDVAALPVRGYLESERGRWRRSGDLLPVATPELVEAVRRADLLITLGSPGDLTRTARARARWSWPLAAPRPGTGGDWYLTVPSPTPLSAAFTGLAVDSFPPGTAVAELTPGPRDWVGLTAQAGRRGIVRPVLMGRDSAGIRRVVVGVEGLWRWAFRGGSSEQAYRGLVASTVSWLLGGTDSVIGRARVLQEVVQQGRPVVFQWNGDGTPMPIPLELTGPAGVRQDTLVFDGAGRFELMLGPGVWRYRLNGGGRGTVAVEEYSDEFLPAPRTLQAREAVAPAGAGMLPMRNWLWLFAIAVIAFAGEWIGRRRMGLR